MTYEIKITCDNCDKDLTYTSNAIDYRLTLKDEKKRTYPDTNVVTSMMIYPSLKDGEKNFCGLGCLKIWVNKY